MKKYDICVAIIGTGKSIVNDLIVDQLPLEKVFELKALKYVFFVNYTLQLLLFWGCIWQARTELKEVLFFVDFHRDSLEK